MSETPFSLEFIEGLISQSLTACDWSEQLAADSGPYMQLHQADNQDATAGYVRYWIAPSDANLDRMIHLRLIAGPVETQLLFIMGQYDLRD